LISVKICGITHISDARSAVEYGADALGFIFYPKSKRYVSPEKVKEMIRKLPCEVIRVGVFVNQEIGEVKEIAKFCDLNLIQLHGDESAQYCSHFLSTSLIKAVSPQTEEDTLPFRNYPVRAILVDASQPGSYGGTGKKSDWRLAIKIKETHSLILAGGLNAGNIREALAFVRPQAVDINSGVEISPGKKDPEKMREIIEIVRKAERREELLQEDQNFFKGDHPEPVSGSYRGAKRMIG
jgi:phosphoribosylanthranilate isomerase